MYNINNYSEQLYNELHDSKCDFSHEEEHIYNICGLCGITMEDTNASVCECCLLDIDTSEKEYQESRKHIVNLNSPFIGTSYDKCSSCGSDFVELIDNHQCGSCGDDIIPF